MLKYFFTSQTFGQSLASGAPEIWNAPPDNLRNETSKVSFRKKLYSGLPAIGFPAS